ncbi:MAG: isoprenylcysteine carboxylmethyltransferase family protein [Fimbriimonadaceae bacterium]|nr:isoprenylcysteine carboxylmethyltransferase family protein [Fimbriimonadaceae bacterium]
MKHRWPRVYPPVYLAAGGLLQWLLHRQLPLATLWGPPWITAGAALAAVATLLAVAAAWHFRIHRTTIEPFQPSQALITTGLYRHSRNPIYFALLLYLVAGAVGWGTLSPWLVPPVFVALLTRRVIVVEERMLAARFGAEYEAYRQQVRRWL